MRVPKSPMTKQAVLNRLNRVAENVFQAAEEVSVVMVVFDPEDAVLRMAQRHELGQVTLVPKDWLSALNEYVDISQMTVWAGATKWVSRCIDDLFLAAACSEIGSLTVFASKHIRAMCPYDGGVDLIVANPRTRKDLRQRFRSWLPSAT